MSPPHDFIASFTELIWWTKPMYQISLSSWVYWLGFRSHLVTAAPAFAVLLHKREEATRLPSVELDTNSYVLDFGACKKC
jgi:hypothetical protein